MDRRTALKKYSIAIVGLSIPSLTFANQNVICKPNLQTTQKMPEHFPNVDPEIISEVVGKSHFNLERVKELVDERPELARAVWEWRFSDFESAIGAASHVGRRDIAQYLISKGARPTIFTFAMLGSYDVVKSMIDFSPNIQTTMGPHGISLLDHAYAGERMKDKMRPIEKDNLKKTINYLESLGNAGGTKYIEETKEEQAKYLGDYKYGDGKGEGFTVGLNLREKMTLGSIGGFGGALYKISDNHYTYNGAPSVKISFDFRNDKVHSIKVIAPEVTVEAVKIS